MQAYHVISADDAQVTVRHINFTDFREVRLSAKSFAAEGLREQLSPGGFYLVRLDPADSFRVSAVQPLPDDNGEVLEYLELLRVLRERLGTGGDPITRLKRDAERLKFIKGRQNDWFNSKTSVFAWLLAKTAG
jgi:hypothetical protein